MSNVPDLEIVNQPIDRLHAPESAVRTHNRRQLEKVKAVIRKHGPLVPLVVDPNGVIIDGYLRWQALRDLGYETAPTVTVRANDPADARALRLFLNRIAQDAGWDKQKLRDELQFLIEIDYDLTLTGFDPPEIDSLIEIETAAIGVVDESDPTVKPQSLAVSKLGDLIECGRHRVICGDAREAAVLSSLLAGVAVRMLMTDPPYNVPIDGFVGGKGEIKHREFSIASGELSDEEFVAFLAAFLGISIPTLMDGALLFTWMDWRHIDALITAGKRLDLKLVNVCVWAKTSPGMGSLYRSQHELCAVFKYGTAPHVNNVELGKHGRSRSNLWTARGMAGWGGDRDELLTMHPTVKPVRLLSDAILDASKRGDAVLDCFLGSGSTLIACEDVGRRCFGVEIDPLYVDVAVRRWQKATGKDATFLDTGETFSERAEKTQAAVQDAPHAAVVLGSKTDDPNGLITTPEEVSHEQ